MDFEEREQLTAGGSVPPVPNAICPLCREEIFADEEKDTILCPCCGRPIIVIEAVFQHEAKEKKKNQAEADESAEPAEAEAPDPAAAVEELLEAEVPAAPDFTELLEEEEPKEEADAAALVKGKKRRAGAAAAVALALIAGTGTYHSVAGEKELTLTIEATCPDYNHVGNEWSLTYTVNGEEVSSGSKLKLKKGEEIVCTSTVTEEDESSPDTNSETSSYVLTAEDVRNGFELSQQNVVVTEDHGRYTGESCTWEIVYRFEK